MAASPEGSAERHWNKMTKTKYRRMLESIGIKTDGQDVCHIIAFSNKGANASENYFLCNRSFNRSIGNRGDAINCYIAGLERCAAAVEASRDIEGYSGPSAAELYQNGHRAFKQVWVELRRIEALDDRTKESEKTLSIHKRSGDTPSEPIHSPPPKQAIVVSVET